MCFQNVAGLRRPTPPLRARAVCALFSSLGRACQPLGERLLEARLPTASGRELVALEEPGALEVSVWGRGSRVEPVKCGQPAPLPGTVPVPQGLATDLTPGGKCSVSIKYCRTLTERNDRKNTHPSSGPWGLGLG